MTFYKDRYLRPTGRFHAIWRAAHGIPVNPNVEDEDLMDICADLAQLLNPTPRARRHQQTLSLRLASTLVAGTTTRHSHLTDRLLRDAANLVHEIQTINNSEKDSEDNQIMTLNEDDSIGSKRNTFNNSSPRACNPFDTSSNADQLQVSATQDEIYDDEQEESMRTESAEGNEDGCYNNNVECADSNNHIDKDTYNIENTYESSVDKSISTEQINESLNQEHFTECSNAESTNNSSRRQLFARSSNFDTFDRLVTAGSVNDNSSKSNPQENYEAFQVSDNLHTDTHRSNNTTLPFMVTAEDFPSAEDVIRTPEKCNISQRTTILEKYPVTSTENESSPIIHLSSDKTFRYNADTMYEQSVEQCTVNQKTAENTMRSSRDLFCPTDATASTIVLEPHMSPILESNVTTSENISPNIITRRRSLTSIDLNNEEPSPKRIRIKRSDIQEVQVFPLDLSMKPRPLGERRAEIIIQELPLDLRSPIHVEMGNQELRIPDDVHVENPTTPSERHTMAVDPRNEDFEINTDTQALDTSSWITMNDTVLSTPAIEPAEISAHTQQASLPPGTRGVVTAPATRRRRVRKPRATLYRARKVKMSRCSPPLTRLRERKSLEGQNFLRAAIVVTSQTTEQTSLTSSLVLQGNQSFTEIMQDQEMRGISLTHLNTSETETVQLQGLTRHDTALSPTNNELPVVSYRDQLENENKSYESIEQIFEVSPIPDSLLSFETAEKEISLSPIIHAIHQRKTMSSNQNEGEIASTPSSPQCEPQTIIVCAEIHEPPKESIAVTSSASESVLSLTSEHNETASLTRSSISQSTDSSIFTEADSRRTNEEDNEQSPSILQNPEPLWQYVPLSMQLETILEESEPRYSEENIVEQEINEEQTIEELEGDSIRIETSDLHENKTHENEANVDIDIQQKEHEEDFSNEHPPQRQTSSIIDVEDEGPSLNEIIDDVQIYGELDISKETQPIENAASDVETTCSKDSDSTVSSLGLDCFSIIYKRDDPSRAVIMRSRVSDDPKLNNYICRRWMSQFN